MPLGPEPDASALIRHAIATSVARLLRHQAGAHAGDDPEDVHQARVACRRLRSDLRSFRSMLDPEWVRQTRDELSWAGRLLGEVRDVEVLLDRLHGRLASLPPEDRTVDEGLLARLEEARATARVRLRAGMTSSRYRGLVANLSSAAQGPPFAGEAPAMDALLACIAARARKLRQKARSLAPDATSEELHQLRILAKRSRYAAEVAAPAIPQSSEFAGAVAGLQTVLGEHQDAIVAQGWLREQVRTADPPTALVIGELLAAERAAADEARAAWPSAAKAAGKPKLRRWMKP